MDRKLKHMGIEVALERIREVLSVPPCEGEYSKFPISKETQEQVYKEQGGGCYLCHAATTVPMIHHIKPDGKSSRDNLVMLCSGCHFWVHWMLHKHLGWKKVVRFHGYSDYY